MATPLPGKAVRGSKTGRPIMAALDLLGRRWVMRIIWELRESALTFRELQQRCDDMSPTVLNARLKDLREAGIVDLAEEGGYALSELGIQLFGALLPLLKWSETWHKALRLRQ
jgi:DNA-binding HxlR family transcriptional regulator